MRVGATRSQIYDAQKTARAKWEQAQAVWDDAVRREFGETTWEPLDAMVGEALRGIDQLAGLFAQIRRDVEDGG